ncbi:hypothetical protein SLOPH_474, partial [Spraguea lophii 42_110]
MKTMKVIIKVILLINIINSANVLEEMLSTENPVLPGNEKNFFNPEIWEEESYIETNITWKRINSLFNAIDKNCKKQKNDGANSNFTKTSDPNTGRLAQKIASITELKDGDDDITKYEENPIPNKPSSPDLVSSSELNREEFVSDKKTDDARSPTDICSKKQLNDTVFKLEENNKICQSISIINPGEAYYGYNKQRMTNFISGIVSMINNYLYYFSSSFKYYLKNNENILRKDFEENISEKNKLPISSEIISFKSVLSEKQIEFSNNEIRVGQETNAELNEEIINKGENDAILENNIYPQEIIPLILKENDFLKLTDVSLIGKKDKKEDLKSEMLDLELEPSKNKTNFSDPIIITSEKDKKGRFSIFSIVIQFLPNNPLKNTRWYKSFVDKITTAKDFCLNNSQNSKEVQQPEEIQHSLFSRIYLNIYTYFNNIKLVVLWILPNRLTGRYYSNPPNVEKKILEIEHIGEKNLLKSKLAILKDLIYQSQQRISNKIYKFTNPNLLNIQTSVYGKKATDTIGLIPINELKENPNNDANNIQRNKRINTKKQKNCNDPKLVGNKVSPSISNVCKGDVNRINAVDCINLKPDKCKFLYNDYFKEKSIRKKNANNNSVSVYHNREENENSLDRKKINTESVSIRKSLDNKIRSVTDDQKLRNSKNNNESISKKSENKAPKQTTKES